jgi:cell division protease FtsH
LLAARKNKRMVTHEDFESAKDKVWMGAERRSKVVSKEEMELTAYHEAGHAIAGLYSPNKDPMHKVTIIPRGNAGGVTWFLPEKDKDYHRLDELKDNLVVAIGGRVAEELIFGKEKISNGAGGDIQQITSIARSMIMRFGMSDKLGTILYDNNNQEVFLGHSVSQSRNVSEETANSIDKEVKNLVDEATNRCKKILTDHLDQLHIVAKGLLEYETLTLDEMNDLIKGIKPSRDEFDDGNSSKPMPPKPSVPKTGNTTAPQPN